VLLAVNMQTSFMHPPFGFALFFLRSVAPEKPYLDRVTKQIMEPVTTMQIYKGAIPFVLIQIVMVGLLITFPQLVTGSLDKKQVYNMENIGQQMRDSLADTANPYDSVPETIEAPGSAPESELQSDVPEDDPMKAMQDALNRQGNK